MAWDIGDYSEFIGRAGDVFGLNREEAGEVYADMRDALGFSLTADDLYEYADMASDLAAEYIEPDEELEYDSEYDWDDEWLDAGEELEISVDLSYEEVPS